MMASISDKGLEFIKGREKFSSKPYRDIAGVPTIGYGTTRYAHGDAVTMQDRPITEPEALSMLRDTCDSFGKSVGRFIREHVALRQCQIDALIAFTYNVGVTAFGTSTILKTVNDLASLKLFGG